MESRWTDPPEVVVENSGFGCRRCRGVASGQRTCCRSAWPPDLGGTRTRIPCRRIRRARLEASAYHFAHYLDFCRVLRRAIVPWLLAPPCRRHIPSLKRRLLSGHGRCRRALRLWSLL